MEVGQHQELEMTEAATKVYDIIHPTPVSLKELSAMAISLELWRCKMNEYRTSGQLVEFDEYKLRRDYTWIKSILPNLPFTIYKTIKKISRTVADSIDSWLFWHHKSVFSSHSHRNHVLEYFDDFVCDYDGSIDYLRTAERMMRCEGFNTEMKFTIACTYFFEDYIRRTWPSVSSHLRVDFNNFLKCPQLNYWICRLRNELEMIPTWMNLTVDERMLMWSMTYNRPSVEYFWNRLPYEKQNMRNISNICMLGFVRFILPKLDERQLYEFVNDTSVYPNEGFYLVFRQLHLYHETVILKTWPFIKNIMNESTFTHLVCRLIDIDDFDADEEIDYKTWEYLCSKIWNDTPPNFKKSVIRLISSSSKWLEGVNYTNDVDSNQIYVGFLLLILQDASLKERNSFWYTCWKILIRAVRIKDLQRVMQLCFENEDEIAQFKQNVMINSQDVLQFCISLLKESLFDDLNALVCFCCADLQAARNFKQQILQSAFLGHDCQLSRKIVTEIERFNEFVNNVFDNVVESTDFKNMLMSSSLVMERLSRIICSGIVSLDLENLIKFIDTLVSNQEAVVQVKMILIDALKEYVTNTVRARDNLFGKENFNSILLWCLGSEEKVDEFKSTCTS